MMDALYDFDEIIHIIDNKVIDVSNFTLNEDYRVTYVPNIIVPIDYDGLKVTLKIFYENGQVSIYSRKSVSDDWVLINVLSK